MHTRSNPVSTRPSQTRTSNAGKCSRGALRATPKNGPRRGRGTSIDARQARDTEKVCPIPIVGICGGPAPGLRVDRGGWNNGPVFLTWGQILVHLAGAMVEAPRALHQPAAHWKAQICSSIEVAARSWKFAFTVEALLLGDLRDSVAESRERRSVCDRTVWLGRAQWVSIGGSSVV